MLPSGRGSLLLLLGQDMALAPAMLSQMLEGVPLSSSSFSADVTSALFAVQDDTRNFRYMFFIVQITALRSFGRVKMLVNVTDK
jgi:hypothetical protein